MAPPQKYQKNYKPTPGSTLPKAIKEELEEQDQDDRKFGKKFVNKVANRKELRKQKRQEKGKRNAQHHMKRSFEPEKQQPSNKRQKSNQVKPEPKKPQVKKPEKALAKKGMNDKEAMERLSKSNPGLFKLLESDKLVSEQDFADDDRDIAYWEKKLGMNKKKSKKLGKDFEEDGLLDVLGNIGDVKEQAGDDNDDDQAYLKKKRQSAMENKKQANMENKAEEAVDDIFAGFESEEEEDDDEEDDDEEGIDMYLNEEEDEDEEEDDEDTDMNQDSEEEEEEETPEEAVAEVKSNAVLSKYVPPHLRKAISGKSEQQLKLQKQLQGLLNRLSEMNMESILLDIEKCYGSYPRHDVNTTLTEIILNSISQKANLLDSFVITYATIVASLYKLIGIEFAAYFVQTLVENFEKEYKRFTTSNDSAGEPEGSKETKNLLTLILELYNFQVLSCVIIYDLVRMLIDQLDENRVELLLKIIKTAGPEMRSDDPTSLKHIIDEIQKETAKRDPETLSVRHKFMLETIVNVKNNKIKNTNNNTEKEMTLKMKRFLNGLSKKRSVRSTEALRVSLDDIRNVETKGKWWLVGASWKDNLVGTESKYKQVPDDLKKDQSLQETLLKLARKQGMNTDIRRTIFVTIMSSEDYLDAFEKLMKLGLSEVQQREICRVMLQCTGNEKTFNPYYMLVSKRLCDTDHSFKVTFQYCLWDFLRECGENEVGGLERSNTELEDGGNKRIRLNRLMNMAKFYSSLVAEGSLTLAILKSVNFMTVKRYGRIFLEIFFCNLILKLHPGGAQAIANVFGKIIELRTLAQGIIFFMLETVVHGKSSGLSEDELERVQWGCKIAKEVLGSK